jgi:hypothetical protein
MSGCARFGLEKSGIRQWTNPDSVWSREETDLNFLVPAQFPMHSFLAHVHCKHHMAMAAATKSTAPSNIIAWRICLEYNLSGIRFGGR